jgi:hypothetical protein
MENGSGNCRKIFHEKNRARLHAPPFDVMHIRMLIFRRTDGSIPLQPHGIRESACRTQAGMKPAKSPLPAMNHEQQSAGNSGRSAAW